MKVRIFSSDGRTFKGEREIEMDEGSNLAQIETLIDLHKGDVLEFVPSLSIFGINADAPDVADHVPYMGLSRNKYPT